MQSRQTVAVPIAIAANKILSGRRHAGAFDSKPPCGSDEYLGFNFKV